MLKINQVPVIGRATITSLSYDAREIAEQLLEYGVDKVSLQLVSGLPGNYLDLSNDQVDFFSNTYAQCILNEYYSKMDSKIRNIMESLVIKNGCGFSEKTIVVDAKGTFFHVID